MPLLPAAGGMQCHHFSRNADVAQIAGVTSATYADIFIYYEQIMTAYFEILKLPAVTPRMLSVDMVERAAYGRTVQESSDSGATSTYGLPPRKSSTHLAACAAGSKSYSEHV